MHYDMSKCIDLKTGHMSYTQFQFLEQAKPCNVSLNTPSPLPPMHQWYDFVPGMCSPLMCKCQQNVNAALSQHWNNTGRCPRRTSIIPTLIVAHSLPTLPQLLRTTYQHYPNIDRNLPSQTLTVEGASSSHVSSS